MAVRTSVPGSGYGNVYVDSLVWGGAAWDPSQPIKVYFGRGGDFEAASAVHEPHEYQPLHSGSAARAWTTKEVQAFTSALSIIAKVCGLVFVRAESVQEADIVWWKTRLGDATLGVHETPAKSQIWGYFDPTQESWKQLKPGGDGFNTIVHELGHGMGLAHPHDGGGQEDATRFPGVTSSFDKGSYGLNQGIWTVMSYNSGWDKAQSIWPMGHKRAWGPSTSRPCRRSTAQTMPQRAAATPTIFRPATAREPAGPASGTRAEAIRSAALAPPRGS